MRGKSLAFTLFLFLVALVTIPILMYSLSVSTSSPKITDASISPFPSPTLSTQEEKTVLDDVSTWIPHAIWTKPQQSTQQTEYGKLTGTEIHTTITSQKPYYGNFEKKDILKQLGYTEDPNIQAGGPTGDQWAYRKDASGLRQVLIFSFATTPTSPTPNQPVQFICPCQISLSAFLSTPFVPSLK